MAGKREKVGIAFGAVLRQARLAKKLTQEQLAEKADCVPHYVSAVENGHQQPSVSMIVAFEVALELDAGNLIRRTREALARPRLRRPSV